MKLIEIKLKMFPKLKMNVKSNAKPNLNSKSKIEIKKFQYQTKFELKWKLGMALDTLNSKLIFGDEKKCENENEF